MTEPTKPLVLAMTGPDAAADRISIAEWCEHEAAIERGVNYGSDRESGCEGQGWAETLEQVATYLRASISNPPGGLLVGCLADVQPNTPPES